jgi:hypothetical protein
MNGKVKFLFFCMIFVVVAASAQQSTDKATGVISLYTIKPVFKPIDVSHLSLKTIPVAKPITATKAIFTVNPVSYFVINPGYYTQHFGFFCKKELQLEKITKIPFRFRLGSIQQCDWMEGKPNAFIKY